jgi:hypothetical protein
MKIYEFFIEALIAARTSTICSSPFMVRQTPTSLKIRIAIADDEFLDLFHNAETGRTDYALIRGNQRIYGADNAGGWHIHPFEDPSRHEPLDGPMSILEFIQTIELHYRQS